MENPKDVDSAEMQMFGFDPEVSADVIAYQATAPQGDGEPDYSEDLCAFGSAGQNS